MHGMTWRKSSRSGGNECVEVASWRKSSRSGDTDCVEVSTNLPVVAVRDSKDQAGGMLVVQPEAFAAFTGAVKAGRLDG